MKGWTLAGLGLVILLASNPREPKTLVEDHHVYINTVTVEKRTETKEIANSIENYRLEQEELSEILFDNAEELTIEQTLFASESESYPMSDEELKQELYFDSLEKFAICVMAEAGNQGFDGMRLVADVLLNRLESPDFPNTIEDVILQKNQFSSYSDGGMERWNVPSEECYQACKMELENRWHPELLYFRTGRYSEYGTPAFKFGDHYFSSK